MNVKILIITFLFISPGLLHGQQVRTYCNPINLNYRFVLSGAHGREAADPTMVSFKGDYYLFASKSGGYWYSKDLAEWTFVSSKTLPIEVYAPTAMAMGDTLYFTASYAADGKVYKTANPKIDNWQPCAGTFPMGTPDPALFQDSDGRLYIYYGTSSTAPISGVELDNKTFAVIGKPKALFNSNPSQHGWEVAGDDNNNPNAPTWMEGAWMTKIDSIYYLQYASPGTIYNTYSDGYYTSKSSLGPFYYSLNNPFSFKPGGFINGAGHGSTFKDSYGMYWHITSSVISVINRFERRLSLFPVSVDKDGILYANTYAGDYPHWLAGNKFKKPGDYFTGWMLLSYQKNTEASSSLNNFPSSQAVDENIKTHWSAQTNNKGEWLMIDLRHRSRIRAVQINYAEHAASIYGRGPNDYHQYLLQYSNDKKKWKMLADKSRNTTSISHDYIEKKRCIKARYVKLTNIYVPDSNFAISGFRVFGKAPTRKPAMVNSFNVNRNKMDPRRIVLSWPKVNNATGYIIRFGIDPKKLYNSYLVYSQHELEINSLNVGVNYYFSIDSFNEGGITKGKAVMGD